MALFFENVDHYEFRSRAVDIEYEEGDVVEEVRAEYKTVFEEGVNPKCKKLYILVGKSFSDYVRMGVLKEFNCQLIAQVQDITTNKSINHIYQLVSPEEQSKPSVYFTTVDGVAEKDFFNWTAELLTSTTETSTEVTVVSTESASSYIGDASLSSYTSSSSSSSSEDCHFFIRCLHTSVMEADGRYSQLDCPNIMSGLSAQVFLHCEAHKMRSRHYVVYSSLCASASLMQGLLSTLGFAEQKMSGCSLKSLETRLAQSRPTSSMYT